MMEDRLDFSNWHLSIQESKEGHADESTYRNRHVE